LPEPEKVLAERAIEKGGPITVNKDITVKICLKEEKVSVIESPGWKTATESSIGNIRGNQWIMQRGFNYLRVLSWVKSKKLPS
jgi:hypothetical protein